jgi:hypothetical protein
MKEVPYVYSSHTHIGGECELCIRDIKIALDAYNYVLKQTRELEEWLDSRFINWREQYEAKQ